MYILGAVEVAQANIPAMHPGFLLECTRCQVIVDAQPLELPCVDSVLAGYNVTVRQCHTTSADCAVYVKTTVKKTTPNAGSFRAYAYPVLYPEGTRSTRIC